MTFKEEYKYCLLPIKIIAGVIAMKRNAVYIRITDYPDRRGLLEQQIEDCYEFAQAHNISNIKIYIDTNESASNNQRPGFLSLMNDVSSGGIDNVITSGMSRLSRDFESTLEINRLFTENSTKILIPNETNSSAYIVGIRGFLNEC